MTNLTCDKCGACCMHMRSPPHMVYGIDGTYTLMGPECQDDYDRLMAAPQEARDVRLAGILSDRDDESPCSWLDLETKRCRWYEFRPDVCRDFELGGEPCLEHRKLLGIG